MWPLLLSGFLMWYLIALRALELRRGVRPTHLEELVDRGAPDRGGVVGLAAHQVHTLLTDRAASFGDIELVMKRALARVQVGAKAIQTIVAVAPLLGLLGTVVGMMETFYSLQDMSMFAESGGIAGGVSEALVTTQTGLGIAIPGLVVERILSLRGRTIERDLEHLTLLAKRRFDAREACS